MKLRQSVLFNNRSSIKNQPCGKRRQHVQLGFILMMITLVKFHQILEMGFRDEDWTDGRQCQKQHVSRTKVET